MAINQLSTANTFQEWLTTTSLLVATANALTDNTNGGLIANSSIFVQGSSASLNVRTLANINTLQANTGNIANISLISGSVIGNGNLTFSGATISNLTFGNVVVTGNVQTLNVTTALRVGGDALISGNLIITGNTTLDNIGFNDLSISGNASIGNNLVVTQNIAVANVTRTLNVGSSITAPLANIANINLSFSSLSVPGNLTVTGTTSNITRNLVVGGNIAVANITSNAYIGGDAFIYGNLTISGNTTLDSIGFNDLVVAGTITAPNLSVTNANVTILSGQANTAIYNTIVAAIDSSIAFAIALG